MKQLLTFFSLAFLLSWIIWFPLYSSAFGFYGLPVLPFQHAIGALGPLIAAVLTTFIFSEKEGLKNLLSKCVKIRPLIYLTIALLSPFVLAWIAILLSYLIDGTPVSFSGLFCSTEFPQFNLLTLFIYNLIFFGFGEEMGWRGFALPQLQKFSNALTATIILTVFWALWHLPLFFYRPGYVTMDVAGIIGWSFSLLTGSILLTWLYNSTRASILVCAVFHSTIDIAFTADFTNENAVNYMGFLITIWGILTILFFKPKNLGTSERIYTE